MSERKSFWSTLPGIIAGVAAIVSGLAVLIPVLVHLSHAAVNHPKGAKAAAASTPSPGGPGTPGGGSPSGSGGFSTDTAAPTGPFSATPGTGSPGGMDGLTATPSTLDLGQAALGSSSPVATATITNAGPNSATLAGIQLQGPQAGQFSIASSTCGSGAVLAPGGSCELGVRFNASTLGPATASLVVSFQHPQGGVVTVPLTGTGAVL